MRTVVTLAVIGFLIYVVVKFVRWLVSFAKDVFRKKPSGSRVSQGSSDTYVRVIDLDKEPKERVEESFEVYKSKSKETVDSLLFSEDGGVESAHFICEGVHQYNFFLSLYGDGRLHFGIADLKLSLSDKKRRTVIKRFREFTIEGLDFSQIPLETERNGVYRFSFVYNVGFKSYVFDIEVILSNTGQCYLSEFLIRRDDSFVTTLKFTDSELVYYQTEEFLDYFRWIGRQEALATFKVLGQYMMRPDWEWDERMKP